MAPKRGNPSKFQTKEASFRVDEAAAIQKRKELGVSPVDSSMAIGQSGGVVVVMQEFHDESAFDTGDFNVAASRFDKRKKAQQEREAEARRKREEERKAAIAAKKQKEADAARAAAAAKEAERQRLAEEERLRKEEADRAEKAKRAEEARKNRKPTTPAPPPVPAPRVSNDLSEWYAYENKPLPTEKPSKGKGKGGSRKPRELRETAEEVVVPAATTEPCGP